MRRLVALLLVLGVALAPSKARATPGAEACLSAADKGQRARAAGKLRDARQQFLICAADACPALVRHDCTQWQSELAALTPTVVFGAKDKLGGDLFDVTVSMDGEVLVKKLDGKSVAVDPGPHTFTFEVSGQPSVTTKTLIKEGEKTRVVTVTFANLPAGPAFGTTTPPPVTPLVTPPPPAVEEDRHHTVLPWVLFGVGAATIVTGAVVYLTAPSRPPNCNRDTQKCDRTTGESDSQYLDDQTTAGRSDSQPRLGLIIGAVGLGVAAGGLIWHFLEPTGPREHAFHVSPFAAAHTQGMTLGGAF